MRAAKALSDVSGEYREQWEELITPPLAPAVYLLSAGSHTKESFQGLSKGSFPSFQQQQDPF